MLSPIQYILVFASVLATLVASRSPGMAVEQAEPAAHPKLVLQRGHSGIVEAFAFSHDGALLATGGNEWTVKTWDVKTGALRYSLPIDGSWHFKLVFSPDDKA